MSDNLPFTAQVAILDQYIHAKDPGNDPEVADLIMESIRKNEDIKRYFFSNHPNPSWVPLLWNGGFYAKQPEFEVNSEGTFLSFWHAHEFLLSVAAEVPEYLIKHLDNLDKCNDWYKAGAVESLTKIEPAVVSTVIPKIIDWIKSASPTWSLSRNASELLMYMAKSGYHDDAFALFSVLTSPLLEKNNQETTKFVLNESKLLEHSPIKDYKPGNEYISVLEKLDAVKLINILEENLRTAINKESQLSGQNTSRSSYWRSAIEDTEQDLGEYAKDSLLRALRDTIEHLIAQSISTVHPIINRYLSDDYEIFRRLALYLLHRFPNTFRTLVTKELMNYSNLDETGIHHEFFHLLQEGFPILATDQQSALVNMILLGPPKNELERFVQAVAQSNNVDPDEYRKNYTDHWVKNRLWMVKDFLPHESKIILDNLVAVSGEPDHPDFTSWISSGGWAKVNEDSPLDDETIRSMSPEELYDYLQSWKPENGKRSWPERVTWEGLAGSIANAVVANPEYYASHLHLMVEYRPIIAQAIFGHLANENYPILENSWKLWLDLIQKLVNKDIQNRKVISAKEYSENWAQIFRSIVQVLRRGLQHKDTTLPTSLFPKIRDILLILMDNPDPDDEQDKPQEGWFGHMDPITVSINRVRPMALDTLAIYAIKNAKLSKNKPNKIRWERKVKDVFTHKLDKAGDSSWAVHSIFGRYLSTLYWFDKKWTTENIDKIFPENDDEDSIWFFIAAWESFLLDGYRSYLMPLLHRKYLKGIEHLSKGFQTKSHIDMGLRFAVHVVLDYCLGNYLLESDDGQNSLIMKMTLQSNPKIQADVANACYLVYRDNPKDTEKFWPRIKAFWEWRTKQSIIHDNPTEFDEEMRKFGNIPLLAPEDENITTLWPLLEGLLPHITRGGGFRYDWLSIEKFLLKEVDSNPVRVIQFYKMMYDQVTERPKWVYHSDEAKDLISKSINSGNAEAKQITLNLLDNFLRWGDNTFRELYFSNAR